MDKPKVLYVDDEPINLALFKANLKNKYDTLTAENGVEGLEIISNHSDIKAVFSDMRMPIMNGIEFIEKAVKILPDINFFILTGFEITKEIQEALDNNLISKYFQKPIDMGDLSREIEKTLRNK